MRRFVTGVAATLVAITGLLAILAFAGPGVYCPSVWATGSLADEHTRSRVLEVIAAVEKTKDKPQLLSASLISHKDRTVRERWTLRAGEKEIAYEIELFYFPGGAICGPEFRGVLGKVD